VPFTCKGKTSGGCGIVHASRSSAKRCCRRHRQRWSLAGHRSFDRVVVEVTDAQAARLRLKQPPAGRPSK
jgi:hypothetical protein